MDQWHAGSGVEGAETQIQGLWPDLDKTSAAPDYSQRRRLHDAPAGGGIQTAGWSSAEIFRYFLVVAALLESDHAKPIWQTCSHDGSWHIRLYRQINSGSLGLDPRALFIDERDKGAVQRIGALYTAGRVRWATIADRTRGSTVPAKLIRN